MTENELLKNEKLKKLLDIDNDLDRFDYVTMLAFAKKENDIIPSKKNEECETNLYYDINVQDNKIILITKSDSLFVEGLTCILSEIVYNLEGSENDIGFAGLLYDHGIISHKRKLGLEKLENEIIKIIRERKK